MTSAALFQCAYDLLPPNQQSNLRPIYLALLDDESALVRRAAATHLSEFIVKLRSSEVVVEILPVFKRIASDEQDSVRIQLAKICSALASVLSDDAKVNILLDPLSHLIDEL